MTKTQNAQMFIDTLRNLGSTDAEILATVKEQADKRDQMKAFSDTNAGSAAAEVANVALQFQMANGSADLVDEVIRLLSPATAEVTADGDESAESKATTVYIIGTGADIPKLKELVAKNYTGTEYKPVFWEFEAGHITVEAADAIADDPTCKVICVAPNPRFVRDFETYLGTHTKPGTYKVKQVGGFTDDGVITDWPSITSNELIEALKTSLEGRHEDFSPLNGTLPQIDELQMEVRGHGVALFVIKTPDGKVEPYELKVELRKLNE